MANTQSHVTFLCKKDENGHQYRVQFENEPFDEGSCRYAFNGVLLGDGPRAGEKCVAKTFKEEYAMKAKQWTPDLAASKKAKKFADKFTSKILPKLGIHGVEVRFLMPLVAKVDSVAGKSSKYVRKGEFVFIEPFLEGNYVKFNNNGGWEDPVAGELMTAFCHWTWHISGHRFMICDLQGIKTSDGSYLLTDPAVHSAEKLYYPTDFGIGGMEAVLRGHRCNRFCNKLGLTNPAHNQGKAKGPKYTIYSFQVTEEDLLRMERAPSFELGQDQLDII